MMTRFISMRILPNHSGTKNRQIFIRRRIISEHTIQFLGKTLRTSDQANQTIDILLHRPEILPTVTFANMWSIVIRTEGLNKISFIITRLHKRSLGIIYILIVLRTFIEFSCNLPFTQLFCHTGNTIVIVSVFQSFRERPVLRVIMIRHIIRYITILFIQSNSAIFIYIGCSYTGCQSFLRIKISYTFQISIHNNRYGMITYHHVRFTSIEVPYRKTSVLFKESKKRLNHIVHTLWLYISVKRMSSTIGIPQ